MKKYEVLVIQHCLKNNKIAKFGDEVCESQLTGPAYELVKQGFIKEVELEDTAEEVKPESVITEGEPVIEGVKVEPTELEVEAKEVKPEAAAKKGGKK